MENSKTQYSPGDMEKCLKLLALLNDINSAHEIVPYNTFYIHELTEHLDLHEDYRNWVEDREVGAAANCCYFNIESLTHSYKIVVTFNLLQIKE